MTPTPWLRELARLLVAAQLAIPAASKQRAAELDRRRTSRTRREAS